MNTRRKSKKTPAESSKKSKASKANETMPNSNLKSPVGKIPKNKIVSSSWHVGQAKRFKGTLSAAKSLFNTSSEEENLLSENAQSTAATRADPPLTSTAISKKPKKKILVSECLNYENRDVNQLGIESFKEKQSEFFAFDKESGEEEIQFVKV